MQSLRFRRIFPVALAAVLLAAVALGVATAGGGGRPGPGPASTPPPTSSNDPTSTGITDPPPTSAGPAPTRRPPLAARVIQWITEQAPMGGGGSGLQEEAFDAIQEGDCRHALDLAEGRGPGEQFSEPARTLYAGAAAACLAAFHGRPELWPRAEAALVWLAGRTARLDCLQQAVHRLLERLVAAHRAHPDARLERRTAGPRGALACAHFTRLVPEHGPAAGGFRVRIEGEHLPRKVGLLWGEHHLWAVSQDGRSIVVTAPSAAPGEDEAAVVPDDWPDGPQGSPTFSYDPPATNKQTPTSPSSSTSSTTSSSSTQPSTPAT
jgi:hypothetical protein